MKVVKYLHTLFFLFVLIGITTAPIIIVPLYWLFLLLGRKGRVLIVALAKIWSKTLIFFTGSKISIDGLENIPSGKALLLVNHQSYFDVPVILGWICPEAHFLARSDLFKIPLFGLWLRMLEMVPVDRKADRNELESFTRAEKLLSRGEKIVIFPEATRSKGGSLGEFKPSATRPARKANAPVVPVIIDGTRKILQRGSKIISRANVYVKILSPISANEILNLSPKGIADQLRCKFDEVLKQMRFLQNPLIERNHSPVDGN